jgi:hypothetical protein
MADTESCSISLFYLAQCRKLKVLHLTWSQLDADGMRFFFPSLWHLHSLTIDSLNFDSPYVTPAEYASVSSMRHLTSLHLHRCSSVHLLLPHLPSVPSLRQLILGIGNLIAMWPQFELISSLLSALPRLFCTILQPSVRVSLVLEARFRSQYVNPLSCLTPAVRNRCSLLQ